MKQINIQGTEEEILEQYELQQKSFHFLHEEFSKILTAEELLIWDFIRNKCQKLAKRIHQGNATISKKTADVVAWIAFEEAIDQKPDQLCDIFTETIVEWWESIPPYRAPIFHEIVNIAFDIFRGFSIEQARDFHQEWLQKDEVNRIYDDYYYVETGIVVNISDKVKIAQA